MSARVTVVIINRAYGPEAFVFSTLEKAADYATKCREAGYTVAPIQNCGVDYYTEAR